MAHLATISIVRDEADIIETFVRHHCAFAQRMYIAMHRCSDGTAEILRILAAEGLPLILSTTDADHHPQKEILNHLCKEAAHTGDDFILPLDADEFLASTDGDVLATLAALPRDTAALLPWRTYVPLPSDPADELHVLHRIVHRRTREHPLYSKVLLPQILAIDEHVSLSYGSHELFHRRERCSLQLSSTLFLAHMPVRSEAQLRRKVLQGWQSYRRNRDFQQGRNFHWESLLPRCEDPHPITPEELRHIALTYAATPGAVCGLVHDPLPSPAPPPRYRCRGGASPIPVLTDPLARHTAALAHHARAIRRLLPPDTDHGGPGDAAMLMVLLAIAERMTGRNAAALAPFLPLRVRAVASLLQESPTHLRTEVDALRTTVATMSPALLFSSCTAWYGSGDVLPYIYELLLLHADPARSGRHGVCYTPRALADFLARSADGLLRILLDLPDGLRDPRVRLCDPCCGTGLLLLPIIERVPDILRHTYCMELLPSAAAVLRLHVGLRIGKPLAEDELPIHIGNALLDPPVTMESGTIQVILCNPPFFRHTHDWPQYHPLITATVRRFGDVPPDDALAFVALCAEMLATAESGIVLLTLRSDLLAAGNSVLRHLCDRFADVRMLDMGCGIYREPANLPMSVLAIVHGRHRARKTPRAELRGTQAERCAALERGDMTTLCMDKHPSRPPQHDDCVVLACSTNPNYVLGTAVAIRSALEHLPPDQPVRVYVLDYRLTDELREALLRSWHDDHIEVRFLPPDVSRVNGLKLTQGMQPEVYFRLLLPDLVPDERRVLYLDSDMLVLGDITPVWTTDMKGMPIAAVRDCLLSTTLAAIPHAAELGLDLHAAYFSSGLLLMDLDTWRAQNLAERTIAFIAAHPEAIRWWDQDGLNAVLNGRWTMLDDTWNVYAETAILYGWEPPPTLQPFVQSLIARQRVVHFATRYKPWKSACPHPKTPLFFEVLDRTAFRGWRPEPSSYIPHPPQPLTAEVH